jgi:hypothetical protein
VINGDLRVALSTRSGFEERGHAGWGSVAAGLAGRGILSRGSVASTIGSVATTAGGVMTTPVMGGRARPVRDYAPAGSEGEGKEEEGG